MIQTLVRSAALVLLVCLCATAGTQITDTVYMATGTVAAGRVKISWPAMTTTGGVYIASGLLNITLAAGVLSVNLEPNDTSTPAGTSYTVQYFLTNGQQRTEIWVVPTSGSTLKIKDVWVPASALIPVTLPRSLPNYSQAFTSQTSVILVHNLGTLNVLAQCYDNTDKYIDLNTFTVNSSVQATVTFNGAQTGRCVVNGSGAPGKYGATFASQTAVSILGTTHNLFTADLNVTCFDAASPRQVVEPHSVTVNGATFDVMVNFFTAQSGRCILQ